MCQSCRDASSLDLIDKTKMESCSQDIVGLLKNDVYIFVFQSEIFENQKTRWNSVWSYASAPSQVVQGFNRNSENIASSIISTEDAIRQLNIGLRVDELLSYRLTCHSSRIYTQILDPPSGTLRLVIINKVQDNQTMEDDPATDQRLKTISRQMQRAMSAMSSSHNNP